jgi:hypothetical protein
MDWGKRLAEGSNILCAGVVVYNLGESRGWWPVSFPHDPAAVLAGAVILAAALNIIALHRKSTSARLANKDVKSKLKIHSAYYGIGNIHDADVAEFLQGLTGSGLSVWVGNNLVTPALWLYTHVSFDICTHARAVSYWAEGSSAFL